jgi:hypothetical protein
MSDESSPHPKHVLRNCFIITSYSQVSPFLLSDFPTKIPCLDFGAHNERYKGILNKLRQRIRTVRPDQNMKDVLLLDDNARPYTSIRTLEAIAKMAWTVLSHPAHDPDLAPSDYQLFVPVNNALRRRHLAGDKELK